MGKYNSFQKNEGMPKQEIHPVWRGIGCIIILITPIISWAAATLLLDYGYSKQWPFLYELSSPLLFPKIVYNIPGISYLANYISNFPSFKALVLFFFLLLIVFSGIFSVINATIYRLVGPPRYSPVDEPAPKVKVKHYTR